MTLIEVAEHLENIRQYYSNLESERNYRLKNEEVEALSIAIEALRSFPRFKVIDTTTCREPSERLLRKKLNELWDAVDPTWKKKTIKGKYGGDKVDFG